MHGATFRFDPHTIHIMSLFVNLKHKIEGDDIDGDGDGSGRGDGRGAGDSGGLDSAKMRG